MPKTYNDLYVRARRLFREYGIESHNLEARLICAHAAGKEIDQFIRDLRLYTSDEIERQLELLLHRRLSGEPCAYITESWEFYGVPLEINQDVLIPRNDTELMVDTALAYLGQGRQSARVLDLCCGSGCIGCAVACEMPETRVVLADISPPALAVAERNLKRNDLGSRASCVKADIYEAPPMLMGSFELVLCNPPYIPSAEIKKLDKSVMEYEPIWALDGGEDGLDGIRAVLKNWKQALRNSGVLMLEVGVHQAKDVIRLMRLHGFKNVGSVRDTQEIERVIYGRI